MNIDYSLVKKLNFDCIHGCGLCCAFRPQIGEFEIERIKGDPDLSRNFIEETNESREKEFYLKLNTKYGTYGACTFLQDNKLCKIYPKKPFKCGLFPFYLRFSDGIQIDTDLACSGFWSNDGKSAYKLSEESLKELCGLKGTEPEFFFDNTLIGQALQSIYETAHVKYEKTCSLLKSEERYVPLDQCRRNAYDIIHLMCDKQGLDSIFCAIGNDPFAKSIDATIGCKYPEVGLVDNLSIQLIENAFKDRKRPVDHPLFLNQELKWEFYSLDGTDIIKNQFDETGNVKVITRKPIGKIFLDPLPHDATTLLLWYLDILNTRQATFDFALMSATESKSNNVLTLYIQSMCLFIVEAWSMAQLYSYMNDIPMNFYVFRKGIQAVDNGRVTGPSFDVI